MLGGDGGSGKSLLAKQLAVSTVLGKPWLGQDVRQGRAMFLSAEDDADELHRRFGGITEAEGASIAELSDLLTDRLRARMLCLPCSTGRRPRLCRPTFSASSMGRWVTFARHS